MCYSPCAHKVKKKKKKKVNDFIVANFHNVCC